MLPHRRLVVAALFVAGAACTTAKPLSTPVTPAVSRATRRSSTPRAAPPSPSPTVTCRVLPWRLRAPLSRTVALPSGSGILLFGGLGHGDVTTNAIVLLDPATGAQHRVGTLASATHDAGGARVGDDYYVFGGGVTATIDSVQRWTNGHAAAVGAMPEPRSDLTTTTLGGRTYLVGGYDGSRLLAGVLETTDGTHFRSIATLIQPVRYAAVASLGSVVYVLGGTNGAAATSAVQAIDVGTGKVRIVAHLPVRIEHATALALGARIVVLGGRVSGAASKRIYAFDPASGRVTVAGSLPAPVSDAAGVVAGGRVYLVGGETTDPLSTVMECAA